MTLEALLLGFTGRPEPVNAVARRAVRSGLLRARQYQLSVVTAGILPQFPAMAPAAESGNAFT